MLWLKAPFPTIMAWRRRKDILPKGSLNESVSDEAVYRTALATQGLLKLDRVGPIDNRPSPAKLHHFVKKK